MLLQHCYNIISIFRLTLQAESKIFILFGDKCTPTTVYAGGINWRRDRSEIAEEHWIRRNK